ncbi:MAG: MFS transporter [Acidobacteriia bacterium]|nr:MFS transporter [Terriglobia bacterium]
MGHPTPGVTGRGFSGRFWALIGATFLGFLGIGTVLPQIGPHIRYDLGGSNQTVGLVIGVFSFVALGARLFAGPLADRRGRKIAFLVGLFSCSVSGVAYLLPIGLAGPYLGRIMQGVGEACLYTGAATWAVEYAGLERGSQALGYVSSGIWGGISAGPMVGQWLGTFNHAALFQMTSALVGFGVVMRIREEYRPVVHESKRGLLGSLLIPGVSIGFVNVHYPVIAGFLVLHLNQHGHSGPAAFSMYAFTILLSRFFLGSLPDRFPPAITYFGGITAMAAGLSLLAPGPSPAIALLGAGLLGFGFSFPWSSIFATILRRTHPGMRGSAVGIMSAFYDLFVGTSSFAAGAVANRFGYSAAFVMAVIALAGAAIFGRYVFVARSKQAEFSETVSAP